MGLCITVASGKGGTGKTTISSNLGIALAQIGKDVIILDADIEMANLELHLGLEGMKTTLHNVLAGEADITDAIYDGPGGVRLVPAGMSIEGLTKVEHERIRGVIKELAELCEILLIDVPSGMSRTVVEAISEGEELLLVVTPEISAMSDALKTKVLAKKIGANIIGVILNRALFDKNDLTVKEVEEILDTKVVAVIPEDAEMKTSLALGQPSVLRCPDALAAAAIRLLASDLVGHELKQDAEEGQQETDDGSGMVGKLKSGILRR